MLCFMPGLIADVISRPFFEKQIHDRISAQFTDDVLQGHEPDGNSVSFAKQAAGRVCTDGARYRDALATHPCRPRLSAGCGSGYAMVAVRPPAVAMRDAGSNASRLPLSGKYWLPE